MNLFFVKHSEVSDAVDASWLSQLKDVSRCSWSFQLNVNVCKRRSENQATWNVYWKWVFSDWKLLRQSIQLDVRQMIEDWQLMIFKWRKRSEILSGKNCSEWFISLCVQIIRLFSSHFNWNFSLKFPREKKIRLHLNTWISFNSINFQSR